ncbi:MAG: NAD(P)/FAD-dependent oxidoreductase [Actinobacteria bacterium]|nr:NAD(P)/FAD-dependent oxidoreductase [Actinomycetota bacterium]
MSVAPAKSPSWADEVVVVGAGPAGLTAAYQLARHGRTCTVLEASEQVGGLARTIERDGWLVDPGGHRFFTKVEAVEEIWHEILGSQDFMVRPRMSRIFYGGKYYDYPLGLANVVRNLGAAESLRCAGSYVWARLFPPQGQDCFEGWVTARFGRRLYEHFFKSYTEKVWGVPASELSADWAAQRIRGLDFASALKRAIWPKGSPATIRTFADRFEYPRLGPGMMWEACRAKVEAAGCQVLTATEVVGVLRQGRRAVEVVAQAGPLMRHYRASALISSMPLPCLVKALVPPPPEGVLAAADALAYRDHLTVVLVVPEEGSFPDNWVYVHDPAVRVGRVQNFGRWSPWMLKGGRTTLGLEYFVSQKDTMWSLPDEELVAEAKREVGLIGLVDPGVVEAGFVVRTPGAYPYYDAGYKANVSIVRGWLEDNVPNVQPVGRSGMHRYNNQDHSMYTAMLAVDNLLGAAHDVWSASVEEGYQEEMKSGMSPVKANTPLGLAGRASPERRRTPGDGGGRDAPVLPSARSWGKR